MKSWGFAFFALGFVRASWSMMIFKHCTVGYYFTGSLFSSMEVS